MRKIIFRIKDKKRLNSVLNSVLESCLYDFLSDKKDDVWFFLSGGRSILHVKDAILDINKGLFSNVKFALSDERLKKEHNYDLLKSEIFDSLIAKGKISRDQIIAPDLSKPGNLCAEDYSNRIKKADIAVLGVGEDGHFASLFPGSDVMFSEKMVVYVPFGKKEPKERISISFSSFSSESFIFLLFFGEAKRWALDKFLKSDDYSLCPVSYFKNFESVFVITDLL